MIYLDTSVALAHLLAEDRAPPSSLFGEALVSSRLLEYEVWTRLHSYGLASTHGDPARELIGRVALIKLDPAVLARAVEGFPSPVRTLDALHLASFHYVASRGQRLALATYDDRMLAAARSLGFARADCG